MFKNLFKAVVLTIALLTLNGCSSDDDTPTPAPVDTRSFTTDASTDFFINRDGTVDLVITGEFTDGGTVVERGLVYGTASNVQVNTTNTVVSFFGPQNDITGYIENLTSGQTYHIRGYFEMSDGSYFYGNEIQASTDVDASNTRSLSMEIESTPFFISSTEITPKLNITESLKELPVEIGFEYSLNNDFSNSTIELITDYASEYTNGVLVGNSYATEVLDGFSPSTQYYFRPYAKYADGTTTNAGTNTVSFTTNN